MVAGYHKTIADLGPERFVGRARHETISETIAILFDHVLSQPELTRSFREMSLRDPQVAEVSRAFEQVAVTRLASLIASIVDRDVVPDPEATAWVLHGGRGRGGLRAGRPPRPAADQRRARAPGADRLHRARDLRAAVTARRPPAHRVRQGAARGAASIRMPSLLIRKSPRSVTARQSASVPVSHETSQIRAVRSSPPVRSRVPSGLHPTA